MAFAYATLEVPPSNTNPFIPAVEASGAFSVVYHFRAGKIWQQVTYSFRWASERVSNVDVREWYNLHQVIWSVCFRESRPKALATNEDQGVYGGNCDAYAADAVGAEAITLAEGDPTQMFVLV